MEMANAIATSLVPLEGVKHFPDKELGRGSYGVVYQAQHNGSFCAAKKIHAVFLEDHVVAEEKNHARNAFLRECAYCSSLKHSNIVEFWGICYQARNLVMIMEIMDESLTK